MKKNRLLKETTKYSLSVTFLFLILGVGSIDVDAVPVYDAPNWLNSQTEIIPLEYSFHPTWNSASVITKSTGVSVGSPPSFYSWLSKYDRTTKPNILEVKNVGFYNGKAVTMRMTFTAVGGRYDYNEFDGVGTKGKSLFEFSMGKSPKKTADVYVTYSFYDSKGQPMAVSGHLPMAGLDNGTVTSLSGKNGKTEKTIKNIYTVPKDSPKGPPIITYDNSGVTETIRGTQAYGDSSQRSATITFEKATSIDFNVFSTSANDSTTFLYQLAYDNNIPEIEIPAPTGLSNLYDKIDSSNYTKLTSDFTQFIPFEPPRARKDKARWTITKDKTSDIVDTSWKIYLDDGTDVTNWFTITDDYIEADNFKDAKYYDHIFAFRGTHTFNGKKVDPKKLNDKKQLELSGGVELSIGGNEVPDNDNTGKFDTAINMASTLKTSYVNDKGATIRPTREIQSFITHNAPESDIFLDYMHLNSTPLDFEDGNGLRYTQETEKRTYKENDLKAEGTNQTVALGTKASELDFTDYVTNVRYGGKVLKPEEYSVALYSKSKVPDIFTESGKTVPMTMEITLLSNPAAKGYAQAKITTTWGNSLAFGGNETPKGRLGGGAYSLITSPSPYITAGSGGVVSNDEESINEGKTSDYLSMNWFDLSTSGNNSFHVDPKTPTFAVKAKGTDSKKETLDKWGTNRVKEVHYGDIVSAWSLEPKKNYISKNNKLEISDEVHDTLYYEITDKGYNKLSFNLLPVKKQFVPYFITEEELAEEVENYLSTEGFSTVKVVGFKEYPKFTQIGENKTGLITVEETLKTNGKKVTYDVEVPFESVDGSLTFKSVDLLDFGELKAPKYTQYYAQNTDDYQVKVNDSRFDRTNPWTLKAKLTDQLKYKDKYLEGSAIIMNEQGNDKYLGTTEMPLYVEKNSKKGENIVSWKKGTDRSFELLVRGGSAGVRENYQTTMVYTLEDTKIPPAAGK